MARTITPHLALVVICIAYMLVGALIFQALERKNLTDLRQQHRKIIDIHSDDYLDRLWLLMKNNPNATSQSIKMQTNDEYMEFVDSVFDAYRSVRHGYDENSPNWDFETSFFFTATMLTSIGYGFIVPFSFYGRLFLIVYCIIGIPLTLVTVANVAKFVSETAFMVHFNCWKFYLRFKNRNSHEPENRPLFGDNEDEQEILDRVRLVRFPPSLVFLLVFVYGMIGAYLIQKKEHWTYTESMYFTFISILTVGFGDYRPSPRNIFTALSVIICGLVLTTMSMDVVGRMYLKEIHYLGRKLKTSNPFYLIREAKARRRRQMMASMLAQLARGMIFSHRNYSELARKNQKKNRQRRTTQLLPDGQFMFARLPPDPPCDCQVVSTSAYSVRLAWAPAFSTDNEVSYNIRYKLKHKEGSKVRELRGIHGTTAEIMNVDSCSLYEFRITAVSRYGASKPIYLVQYTEPQLSPQHILAVKLNANTIELSWEPPFKRTNDVKHYIVYYTDNPNAHLCDWEKRSVHGRKIVFPDLKYDWFYMFSATVVFNDGQRSPLSRALFIKTDKLEFNRLCVGHSKTVEVMESIFDRGKVDEERIPLLKREYVSFGVYN